MKRVQLLFPFFLLITELYAQEQKSVEEFTPYGAIKEQKSAMEKVIELPFVSKAMEDCKKENNKENNEEDLESCIWDKVKDNPQQVAQIFEKMNGEKKGVNDGPKFESLDIQTAQMATDPAAEKLADYLKQRFSTALFGDSFDKEGNKTKDGKRYTDASTFYQLYRAQLSKNTLLAISHFCLDSKLDAQYSLDKNGTCSISNGKLTIDKDQKKRQQIRDQNAESLTKLESLTPPTCNGKEIAPNAHFLFCVQKISSLCDQENPNKSYTSRRACELTKYIKSVRHNLMALDHIDKGFEKGSKGARFSHLGLDVYNSSASDKQESIDDLVNMSSQEIVDESGLKESSSTLVADIKKCEQDPNEQSCQKFFNSKKEDQEKLLSEYSLRAHAVESNLGEHLKDEASLKSYLEKEEGFTQENIDKMLKDNKWEAIKQKIIQRYQNERKSVVQELKDQIQKRTISAEDLKNPDTPEVMSKIQTIKSELSARPENLRQLVHYNNIVSAYLTVKSTGPNVQATTSTSQNTSSIFRELEGLEKTNGATRSMASENEEAKNTAKAPIGNSQQLQQLIQKTGLQKNNDKSEGKTLGVGEINENFLDY